MAFETLPARMRSLAGLSAFLFRLTFFMLMVGSLASSAYACSCTRIGPPCEAAWLQADAVFVGRVYWSSLLPIKHETETLHRVVRIKILESFIGGNSGWVSVETGAGGGDCGYEFSWGEKYLIYAHREKDGSLTTSICTRTQKVSDAGNDLTYLRSLNNLPTKGRVYGTVKQYTPGLEEQLFSIRPLQGVTVHLVDRSGPNELIAHPDQSGGFTFENLAPGQYRISVDLPKLMKPWESREITVPSKGCSEISVRTAFNGRLTGRVTDKTGAPLPYIAVEVVRASEAERAERALRWKNADKDGAFEIGPLPPDVYVIGVNIVKYSGDRAKPRTYYPGTSDLQQAKRIRVREGQLIRGLNFQLDF